MDFTAYGRKRHVAAMLVVQTSQALGLTLSWVAAQLVVSFEQLAGLNLVLLHWAAGAGLLMKQIPRGLSSR